jgi:hypothetical protein
MISMLALTLLLSESLTVTKIVFVPCVKFMSLISHVFGVITTPDPLPPRELTQQTVKIAYPLATLFKSMTDLFEL